MRQKAVAAEVYQALSEGLADELLRLEMVRRKSAPFPVWQRRSPSSIDQIFISLQADSKATDPYSAGGFRIEVEKSPHRGAATGLGGRALFFQLLDEDEESRLLFHQNSIIDTLVRPPEAHVKLYPEGDVRRMYLSYFDHQDGFDAVRCWLRYFDVTDVRSWVPELNPLLKRLLTRAEMVLSPDVIHLGSGRIV